MSSSHKEGSAGRSFQDYHLVVDEDENAAAAAPRRRLPSMEELASPPSFRQVLYNDSDVYFDEETTLPSRDEAASPLLYNGNNENNNNNNEDSPNSLGRPSQRRRRTLSWHQPAAPLSRKNYLNVITYILHLFVSWGIGIWGLNGTLDTRWQITTRYESLVTPAAWSYHLWAPILILEGILAAAQLLPEYRNRPIVQDGIGYFFFYTFLLQTAWTLCFSFEFLVCSFILVVLALLSLLSLLLSQLLHTTTTTGPKSLLEYGLFRFPFYLHTGWMVLETVDHFALLFRAFDATPSLQISMDMVSLALMLATGVACLIRPPYQDFVIPSVLIWSLMGIAARLDNPSSTMRQAYGDVVIHAVQDAALFLAATLLACLLPCIIVWLSRELCIIHIVSLDD